MNFLTNFPEPDELLNRKSPLKPVPVNSHFHTPYSFSAFESIGQTVSMAVSEGVGILGINDFYTTAGYDEFSAICLQRRVFPLYNIEFIGLSKDQQAKNIRVNDPNNPGRTYFSGKGLDYPVSWDRTTLQIVESIRRENLNQIITMILRVNELLESINAGFTVSIEEIESRYARDLVRERHIAKILRIKMMEVYRTDDKRRTFLSKLFGGKEPAAPLHSIPAVEEEIRSRLLKAGGSAFVPEDEKAFLPVEEIIRIILNAGGIPCYPVLLDDKNGNYTDFERDFPAMLAYLKERNICAVELIPGRNAFDKLKEFILYFYQNGFIILLGTEHNTPQLIPVTVSCRNNVPLDNYLLGIGYEGACVVAAHQYLRAKKKTGYVDSSGKADVSQRQYFAELGHEIILEYGKPG